MTQSAKCPNLNHVIADLGLEQTKAYVTFALPRIRQLRDSLLDALRRHDWEQTRQLAHRALGSVHLYGTEALSVYLQQIHAQQLEPTVSDTFCQQLQAAFDACIQDLTAWLQQ